MKLKQLALTLDALTRQTAPARVAQTESLLRLPSSAAKAQLYGASIRVKFGDNVRLTKRTASSSSRQRDHSRTEMANHAGWYRVHARALCGWSHGKYWTVLWCTLLEWISTACSHCLTSLGAGQFAVEAWCASCGHHVRRLLTTCLPGVLSWMVLAYCTDDTVRLVKSTDFVIHGAA